MKMLPEAVFTLNVNYIQLIQSIILHSPILLNYGSVHICENSNQLGRVTSQSKTKWRPIEAKEASKARRRKIRPLKQQQRMSPFLVKQASAIPWLILSHTSFLLCMVFNSNFKCCTASSLHVWFPQTTACPPFCLITHCNYFKQPQGGCYDNQGL